MLELKYDKIINGVSHYKVTNEHILKASGATYGLIDSRYPYNVMEYLIPKYVAQGITVRVIDSDIITTYEQRAQREEK